MIYICHCKRKANLSSIISHKQGGESRQMVVVLWYDFLFWQLPHFITQYGNLKCKSNGRSHRQYHDGVADGVAERDLRRGWRGEGVSVWETRRGSLGRSRGGGQKCVKFEIFCLCQVRLIKMVFIIGNITDSDSITVRFSIITMSVVIEIFVRI